MTFTYDDFIAVLPRGPRPTLRGARFAPPTPRPELGWSPDCTRKQVRVRLWGEVHDAYKLVTNPYWLVNPTAGEITLLRRITGVVAAPLDSRPVISRAYHKMLEILYRHPDIITREPGPSPRETCHVAEAPGGFIQAVAEYAQLRAPDRQVGMSILERENADITDPGARIPRFAASAVPLPPTFTAVYGPTKTGDICQHDNLESLAAEFPRGAILATGDGGFEVADWLMKEARVGHLLLCQFMAAYRTLQKGGSWVCKLYSCYTHATAQILTIASSVFRESSLEKPPTSRVSNTENYIVCRGFDGHDPAFWAELQTLAKAMSREDPICGADEVKSPLLSELEGVSVPAAMMNAIRGYNTATEAIKERIAGETYDLIVATMHHRDRRTLVGDVLNRNKKTAQAWITRHLDTTKPVPGAGPSRVTPSPRPRDVAR